MRASRNTLLLLPTRFSHVPGGAYSLCRCYAVPGTDVAYVLPVLGTCLPCARKSRREIRDRAEGGWAGGSGACRI
eukprot:61525-Rhodomonas_salina.1